MRSGVRNGRTRTAAIASLLLIAAAVSAGCGPKVTPVAEVSVSPDAATEAAVAEFVPADGDWPGWRGPDSTGVARSAAAPTEWPNGDGRIVWSAPVPGRGHSSPTVCGDLVVLATAWEETQQQGLVAYDRATGSQRWDSILHAGGF
ncbi:MAG: PQQ-binding-like beta-propeller repeat protein, partial [Planctomycetales bacterium]|nr:PQQ-binding-like beta-propeller repeat protein [Planctomycetales bacterium]